jgi:putative phage-type endonuclease
VSLSPEQIETRKRGLGGSEIGAALGLSRFGSPMSVFLDKRGLSTFEGNAMTEWGERMEPHALAWYAERHDCTAIQPAQTFVHPTLPAVASPDAFCTRALGEKVLVELKCPRFLDEQWGPVGTEEVPHAYAMQLQWTDAVCRASGALVADFLHLVAMVPGELRVYELRRDLDLQAKLLEAGAAWWRRHMVEGIAPDLDGTDASLDWLRHRFPEVKRPVVREANAREQLLLESMQLAKEAKKAAEHDFELTAQLVREAIGSDAGIKSAVGQAKWHGAKSRRFTTKFSGENDE